MFGEQLAGINRRAGYLFQADALMPWRRRSTTSRSGSSSAACRAARRASGRALAARASAWPASATATRTSCPAGCASACALAQALILDPPILLMDEPFSALDIQTRQLMENELLDLWSAEPQVGAVHHPRPRGGDLALRPRRRAVGRAGGTGSIGEFTIDLPRPRDVAEIRMTPRFLDLHGRSGRPAGRGAEGLRSGRRCGVTGRLHLSARAARPCWPCWSCCCSGGR